MAYSHPGLHRIGPSNSAVPTLWVYSTADTAATVNTAGYFNDAADDLNINDLILVASSTGGTPVLSWMYVNANASGVVDVTDGVVITATDTD